MGDFPADDRIAPVSSCLPLLSGFVAFALLDFSHPTHLTKARYDPHRSCLALCRLVFLDRAGGKCPVRI